MSVIESVKAFAEQAVRSSGYPAVSVLMGLNAMCIPVPSEVIMGTAGSLAQQKTFSFGSVVAFGMLGSTIGHWTAYFIGSRLGRERLIKYGKFIFFREKELEHAEKWFDKYGLAATFFGRMVPVIQTFISLPAGIYKADFKRFAVYTFLGSLPWITLWAYIGYALNEQMPTIEKYMHYADYVVLALIVLLVVKIVLGRRKASA